jgi:membrane protease YdiL (CAAX protease family)
MKTFNENAMKSVRSVNKIWGILELFCVTFLIVPFLTLGIYRLFPAFECWQTDTLGFPFPVFVNLVMVTIPLIIIFLRHKKTDYGLSFKPLRYHIDIAATCFIPVVLANIPFGLGVDHNSWDGALILSVVQVGLLLVLGCMLQKKASLASLVPLASGLILLQGIQHATGAAMGKALVVFLTYALFVGFGEEFIYRGYMQSRLNEVFGKPFRFYGAAFGWGATITALFFGLTHVGLLRWMLGISGFAPWA